MQGGDVYLGVNRRRVWALMPQQFANLIQRASLAKQARGQRMSKHMGAGVRRLYAGMFQSTHDDRGNRRRVSKADEWSPVAQEHSSHGGSRAVVTQIGGKGRAHVGGQRQLGRFPALSANGNLTRAPIDIV